MLLEQIKPNKQQPKPRKRITGYGQLGTKYKQNPKYRDKPREKRVNGQQVD